MPGGSGLDLAERLQGRIKQLKVILMSGYTADTNLLAKVRGNNFTFLEKPFTQRQLAELVAAALRPPRSPS